MFGKELQHAAAAALRDLHALLPVLRPVQFHTGEERNPTSSAELLPLPVLHPPRCHIGEGQHPTPSAELTPWPVLHPVKYQVGEGQRPTSSAELTPWPKAADTACAASPSSTTRGAVRRDTRSVLPLVYHGRSVNCCAISLRISCSAATQLYD